MADLLTNLTMAAGAAGGENLYIEDVFSTYLYTGTGAAQTITNGIDLDGEGGLVWIKSRSAATNHFLFDTERGTTDELNSNTQDAEASLANSLTAFNSDGFAISSATGIGVSAATYASWTFRKAPKFFDVVTYTGNGTTNDISHSLDSVPAMVIIKKRSTTSNWYTLNRDSSGNYLQGYLNTTGALPQVWTSANTSNYLNSTTLKINALASVTAEDLNASGTTYVAYLFAHDAGGFGDDGEQNVISCGSFTQSSAVNVDVNLGYEPQWLLLKRTSGTSGTGKWVLLDNMRGFFAPSTSGRDLAANASDAEGTISVFLNNNGFRYPSTQYADSSTFVYIAIRRGPMKTPTAGTEVFLPVSTPASTVVTAGFVPDMTITKQTNNGAGSSSASYTGTRLQGNSKYLEMNSNGIEGAFSWGWDSPTTKFVQNSVGTPVYSELFARAPGFFDVVCYTGTGSATTITHNLGAVPELMFVKNRLDAAGRNWAVYVGDNTDYLILNTTAATADDSTYWNDTSPTTTVFTVGTNASTNDSGDNFIAYLFASLAGVSKVGTYTGNGTSVTVTTGFQPRFILVKRTDSTGNWIYGDSARGLVAGDDPFLLLNSTAVEVTNEDWVDVSATGFTVNETAANANVNAGTYIYLCIS